MVLILSVEVALCGWKKVSGESCCRGAQDNEVCSEDDDTLGKAKEVGTCDRLLWLICEILLILGGYFYIRLSSEP